MLTLILIVWLHFVADFICQTDDMATNKSTSNVWLSKHVIVYTIVLSLLLFSLGWSWLSFIFLLLNGVGHWVIDWMASRLTSYFWKKQKRHWFFVIIGLDQAIHMTTLFGTYRWLFN